MDEEDTTEYEVDEILEKRTWDGETRYLLKWKGYGYSELSWVPEENLENCQILLGDFLKGLKDKKGQPKHQGKWAYENPLGKGNIPGKILGATMRNGTKYFIVEWDKKHRKYLSKAERDGRQAVQYVHEFLVKSYCPQKLIKYYQMQFTKALRKKQK